MEPQTVHYGEDVIQYQVCVVTARSKKVAIHVHPDGSVQVDAPPDSDTAQLKAAVLKKARWVLKHIEQAHRQKEQVLSREYVSGEGHFYLGRRYQLKIIREPRRRPEVKLTYGFFRIATPINTPEAVKELLWDWYRNHAMQYFQRRLEFWVGELPWIKEPPPWQLRIMTSRWGSCSPKGRLTINPHLIKARQGSIDYVLLHELCHLKEHNHSKSFYGLLDRYMPAWRSEKAKLDGMAETLLTM